MKNKKKKGGTLHHWFKGSKSKDGKPGWVQADGSPCANEPGETKTPKCFSSGRLNKLKKSKRGRSIIRSAVIRKRKEDEGQQQKSGAERPTYVSTFAKGKKDPLYIKAEPKLKESMELQEATRDIPGKGSGKKDACYYKVKSRFRVWPSAYGSSALVRCRKVGAKNWGNSVNEEKSLRDHEYSMTRSQLDTIIKAAKRIKQKVGDGEGDIEAWVQSKLTKAADYIDTAADYIDSGEMDRPEKYCSVCMKKGDKCVCLWSKSNKITEARKRDHLTNSLLGASFALSALQSPKDFIRTGYIEGPGVQLMSRMMQRRGKANANLDSPRVSDPARNIKKTKKAPLKENNKEALIALILNALKKEKKRKNYLLNYGYIGESKYDKSNLACNKPKSDPVGNSLTGKSHVVKACEGGKEKLIRFGQRGVKGSPKKKGESAAYASRRHRFLARHAKNIARGKMSAAYWSKVTKW